MSTNEKKTAFEIGFELGKLLGDTIKLAPDHKKLDATVSIFETIQKVSESLPPQDGSDSQIKLKDRS